MLTFLITVLGISAALAELEASGELIIAGAMYNIGTGKVDYL